MKLWFARNFRIRFSLFERISGIYFLSLEKERIIRSFIHDIIENMFNLRIGKRGKTDAVSYTHLDVYKRQGFPFSFGCFLPLFMMEFFWF